MERQEQEVVADAPRRTPGTEHRAKMRRIADALKASHPAFAEFEPETPLPWIELTDEELLVQFTVSEDSVEINLPYFRDWPEAMFRCVTGGIAVVHELTDYVAFDPQMERVVTASDFNDIVIQYQRVDQASVLKSLAFGPDPISGKPWWKFW